MAGVNFSSMRKAILQNTKNMSTVPYYKSQKLYQNVNYVDSTSSAIKEMRYDKIV